MSDLEIGQGIGWNSGCDKIDGIIYSVRISKVIRTKDEIWTNYMKVSHFIKLELDHLAADVCTWYSAAPSGLCVYLAVCSVFSGYLNSPNI